MDEVLLFLKKNINNSDKVIVACSGGPDSMCLLSLVMKVTSNIICAHVNHNIRSESKDEYNYVKEYCLNNNIVFEGLNLNFDNKSNFESIARKKRYDFFNKLYTKYNAKYIITAHHGDDLIETVLMKITRGSKLGSYLGIKKNNGIYLRPLLYVSKNDILDYLKKEKIKYFIDYTNNEDNHTRNRYRKYVLPFLKKEDFQVHKKYLQFSEELEEYDNFVNEYINNRKIIDGNKINLLLLIKESIFIQKKSIELLIKKVQKGDILEVNNNIINEIIKLINSKKANSKIDLNNDYVAIKNYNFLEIKKKNIPKAFCEEFDGFFENDQYILRIVKQNNSKSNDVLRLDYRDIKLPLIIRNRKNGDKIYVKNLGLKKVKDILINEKINFEKRDELPIVADNNNNILWLPGIKKSKFDKEKNEKYDIILLCERKEDIK